jgi:DNA-binding transcriptional regulator YdaS (Cro superfamily)
MKLNEYLEDRGAVNQLATAIHVPAALVSQWKTGARPVPEDRCPAIEHATEGAVTCEELRPDVSWVRVPDATWPHPGGRPLVDHAAKVGAGDTAKEAA